MREPRNLLSVGTIADLKATLKRFVYILSHVGSRTLGLHASLYSHRQEYRFPPMRPMSFEREKKLSYKTAWGLKST